MVWHRTGGAEWHRTRDACPACTSLDVGPQYYGERAGVSVYAEYILLKLNL